MLERWVLNGLLKSYSGTEARDLQPRVSGDSLLHANVAGSLSRESMAITVTVSDRLLFPSQLSQWPRTLTSKFQYSLYPITFSVGNAEEWKRLFKPCAAQRLFLPVILKDVDSLLYVDTDVLFLRPMDDIWKFLKAFNGTQLAAMAPEHEIPKIGWYSRFARHPFYGVTGVNSGVMLMNLTRIRSTLFKNSMIASGLSWEDLLHPLYQKYKNHITWGDQDLLNIIFHYNPEWQRVIFSDESRFSLGGDAQRVRVWRHRGQHQDERLVVTRPEDLVSLHLHPYRTICRNCVRMFKLHGMDYHRTPLGTSTAPYRDVWRVGLANTAARRHTERQTSSFISGHRTLSYGTLADRTLPTRMLPTRMLPTGRCPQDAAHRMLPTGCCPQDAAHRMLPTGCCPQECCPQDAAHKNAAHRTLPTRMLPTGCRPQDCCPQDAAHRMLPAGCHPHDTAHGTLPTGFYPQDATLKNTSHKTPPTGHCPRDGVHGTLPTRMLPTGHCPQECCPRVTAHKNAAHVTPPTGWIVLVGGRFSVQQ
ncbi:hypothetical protein NFI96_003539 [Prochilodus magdalenae]|nr:hypothetical protein NFI96_003539 [Prochilodus magdalenae]